MRFIIEHHIKKENRTVYVAKTFCDDRVLQLSSDRSKAKIFKSRKDARRVIRKAYDKHRLKIVPYRRLLAQ